MVTAPGAFVRSEVRTPREERNPKPDLGARSNGAVLRLVGVIQSREGVLMSLRGARLPEGAGATP